MGLIDRARPGRLVPFEVHVGTLLLKVQAQADLHDEARAAALHHWEQLEAFVARNSTFKTSFVPFPVGPEAPPVVRAMGAASSQAGVGPMVALPGALAEAVARDLARLSRRVVVSTEGDTFAIEAEPRTFVVGPAGDGGGRIGVAVRHRGSYAFYSSIGRARVDPAIGGARVIGVLADHGAIADAAASAMGLSIHRPNQLLRALQMAPSFAGVRGVVVLLDGKVGVWGGIEVVASR